MKKILYVVFPAVMFGSFGCSSLEEKIVMNEPPPKPKLRVVRREPGSLWTEDSRWNDLYAPAPSRILGDTLRLKINDTLRVKLAQLLEPQKTIGASKESLAQAAFETKALGNVDPRTKVAETEYLDASITEVLPRGIFAISARQLMKIGLSETRVELTGNVREKDIAADDTIQSDTLINMNVSTKILPGSFKPLEATDVKAVETAEKAIKGEIQ